LTFYTIGVMLNKSGKTKNKGADTMTVTERIAELQASVQANTEIIADLKTKIFIAKTEITELKQSAETVVERLEQYVELVTELNRIDWVGWGYVHDVPPTASVKMGKRFAKVVTRSGVHTFVDLLNGDILKAASYKAPAKNGVRGNIWANDLGRSCITHHGARYLK